MCVLDRDKIAIRLREVREKSGKSQQEVADILEITRPAYTFYETGKRLPTSENLFVLANLFRVTTDYLLCRTDNPHIHVIGNPPEFKDMGVTELRGSGTEPFTEEQIEAIRRVVMEAQKNK